MSILGLSSMTMASSVDPSTSSISALPLTLPEDSSFSGSFSVFHSTEYVGRGLLISNKALQKEGATAAVLKMREDINETWALEMLILYKVVSDGHSLYELQNVNPKYTAQNIENEFALKAGGIYTNGDFSMGFGHNFVRGGLLGAMSKHFADNSASVVNEGYLEPCYNFFPWMSFGMTIRYSYSGVEGWWFEPHLTFKAPIIGSPEDVKLAAVLSINMSATGDYFQEYHGASKNGSQAFWLNFSTPWFVTEEKNFIITPSVSFNWLGKGAQYANKNSHATTVPGCDGSYIPFKNFGVVGSIMATYKF